VTPPNVVEIVCLSCYNGNDEQPKGASNNDRSQEAKNMPELRESISQQTQGESVLLGSMPAPSQHDSEKHMPAMREASKAGEGETLLAPMLSESTCEGKTSENLRTMRQDVSTDVGPRREGQVKAVLQFDMQSTMDGAQKEKTIHNKRARISPDIQAGACNGEQERVCDGASPCYGREVGQDVERSRSGASHQRKQVGQQAGKSDGNAIQCSQPDAENKKVKYDPVSTLRREDSAEQRCPKCGGRMSKIEKPSIILDKRSIINI
jgi:hypothetical protein